VSNNTMPVRSVEAAVEPFVSVEMARYELTRNGRPAARQTVLALGLRGELAIKLIAGRFVVACDSIAAYRARHGLG